MTVLAAALFALAQPQDDPRVQRILDRIEKEVRDSHNRLREEIRAIIRAEIEGSGARPATPSPKRRAQLGITAGDLTESDRKALAGAKGIRIEAVRGPAEKAGLKPGDLLVELDGQPASEDQVAVILDRRRPGDTLDAVVLREGKREKRSVTLTERRE